MLRWIPSFLPFCLWSVLAQVPDRSLRFEVASVKRAVPQAPSVGMGGGPGTPDPGRLTVTNMQLSSIILYAYNVRSFQLSGPAWLDGERFDIVAKVPAGTTRKQSQVMLQNLLAERFKLVVHKESKEALFYALVIGRGGVRMRESPDNEGNAKQEASAGPAALGKERSPERSAERAARAGMMMGFSGNSLRIQCSRMGTAELAQILSENLDRMVVDQTGLTALYDFTLEYSPEGLAGPAERGQENGSGPTIFSALQDQLGLKLESRKGPVDLIVVDSIEKDPTEN